MLSLEDCIALSSLNEEEIAAIAEHEHLPMIVAAELGNYLMCAPDGSRYIKQMIRDDIVHAHVRGDKTHEVALKLVLRHYLANHPECAGVARCSPAHIEDEIQRFLKRVPHRAA